MSQREGIQVVLSGVNEKVDKVLRRNGFVELLGADNITPHIDLALERARQLL
jgi:SulP family sulfate permease